MKNTSLGQNHFQNLKQDLGPLLLGYCLNLDGKITDRTTLESLSPDQNQISVINELTDSIKQCRLHVINKGWSGDGLSFYILNSMDETNNSVFNGYRVRAGGIIHTRKSQDPLLDLLFSFATKNYPNLLFKPMVGQVLPHSAGINSYPYKETVKELLQNDILSSLTNGLCFDFSLSNGITMCSDISFFLDTIIWRAFHNCCNRMKLDLVNLFDEIEIIIKELRNLAEKGTCCYPVFVGIKNVFCKDFEEYNLGEVILRKINTISLPTFLSRNVVSTSYDKEKKEILLGAILEFQESATLKGICNSNNTITPVPLSQETANKVDRLKVALSFALEDDVGINPTHFQSGFYLYYGDNCSWSSDHPRTMWELDRSDLGKTAELFDLFTNNDLSKLDVAIRRLKFAIFDRREPADAIIDAVIAWEALFSEQTETKFKVTTAIYRLLGTSPNEDQSFYKELKKLYGLRSDLVHGRQTTYQRQELDLLRKRAIDIGTNCIKEILTKRKDLLLLSPSERLEKLVVFNKQNLVKE